MTFLFGDATPSPLRSNFIEFLPAALELSVTLLQADERITQGAARARELERAAEVELARLEALAQSVTGATEAARTGDESPTRRCAEAVAQAAEDLVKREIERVRETLAAERAKIEAAAAEERAGCARALEAVLLRHDLPEMDTEFKLVHRSGAGYQARLHAHTPFGLHVELDLDVPAQHLFSHIVRVDKLVERLEVQAPEEGGWLRKEVKLRPQRLDKEYVAEFALGADETTLRLRASADGSGVGFDIAVRRDPPHVRMVRVGEGDLPPFELAEVDAERVAQLREKLAGALAELHVHRRALVEARLDDTPLQSLTSPRLFVERFIGNIAPILGEISRRSLTPTELVLKRQLGDGRREEIFVSKALLRQKLEPLGAAQRALFVPLGLDGDGAPAQAPPPPPQPSSRPPTVEVAADLLEPTEG